MKYDMCSGRNQNITQKLVNREVYCCISDMAEYLFDWGSGKYGSYDEFENFYIKKCRKCGDYVNEEEDEDGVTHYICESCDEIGEYDVENEPCEIYEYWIVSPWFGEKLRDHGECVLERWSGWIWGRCCTGQAISMDAVIFDIAYDMEILEGQALDWSKM